MYVFNNLLNVLLKLFFNLLLHLHHFWGHPPDGSQSQCHSAGYGAGQAKVTNLQSLGLRDKMSDIGLNIIHMAYICDTVSTCIPQ